MGTQDLDPWSSRSRVCSPTQWVNLARLLRTVDDVMMWHWCVSTLDSSIKCSCRRNKQSSLWNEEDDIILVCLTERPVDNIIIKFSFIVVRSLSVERLHGGWLWCTLTYQNWVLPHSLLLLSFLPPSWVAEIRCVIVHCHLHWVVLARRGAKSKHDNVGEVRTFTPRPRDTKS